ncbi:hypothetical protein OAA99_01855 [Omnitrophica bacterium]|nr:hypothetical protein [Candidatus Omnitrophota bacterium]
MGKKHLKKAFSVILIFTFALYSGPTYIWAIDNIGGGEDPNIYQDGISPDGTRFVMSTLGCPILPAEVFDPQCNQDLVIKKNADLAAAGLITGPVNPESHLPGVEMPVPDFTIPMPDEEATGEDLPTEPRTIQLTDGRLYYFDLTNGYRKDVTDYLTDEQIEELTDLLNEDWIVYGNFDESGEFVYDPNPTHKRRGEVGDGIGFMIQGGLEAAVAPTYQDVSFEKDETTGKIVRVISNYNDENKVLATFEYDEEGNLVNVNSATYQHGGIASEGPYYVMRDCVRIDEAEGKIYVEFGALVFIFDQDGNYIGMDMIYGSGPAPEPPLIGDPPITIPAIVIGDLPGIDEIVPRIEQEMNGSVKPIRVEPENEFNAIGQMAKVDPPVCKNTILPIKTIRISENIAPIVPRLLVKAPSFVINKTITIIEQTVVPLIRQLVNEPEPIMARLERVFLRLKLMYDSDFMPDNPWSDEEEE